MVVQRRYAGKVAVVTGAAAGLGRAYALGFAREGAVLVLSDLEPQGLTETEAMIKAEGGSATSEAFDISDADALKAHAKLVSTHHDHVDVLINNAGIAYGEVSQGFAEIPQDRWVKYLTVNTVAPLMLAQALRPLLARAKGVILNQSSMAAFSPGQAYGVSKAALNAMTYGMAEAFAPDGVRVNAIAPGLMETPASVSALGPAHYAGVQATQLLKDAHGTADDIVSLALFLASDEARFITREVVCCDAGSSIRQWRY